MDIPVMGIIPTEDTNGELNDLVKYVNLHLKQTCLAKGFDFVSTSATKWGDALYHMDGVNLRRQGYEQLARIYAQYLVRIYHKQVKTNFGAVSRITDCKGHQKSGNTE